MLKSRSCMDMVSNRWKSFISLLRGYILQGHLNQGFGHVTSSYQQKWTCSQILAFLAVFIDMLPSTLVNTLKLEFIFKMPK